MPFTNEPWDGAKVTALLEADDYCAVCLIDTNEAGQDKIKANCKLPVRATPGGPFNLNAMRAAAGALAGARGRAVKVSAEAKRKAAKKLLRLYREAGREAPMIVKRLAGSK